MPTVTPPLVLVVDDEPAIRAVLATLLRDEGYGLLEAPNGLDAVRLVDWAMHQDPRPCLILLDMMLPRMDGLGVLAHLQQLGDGIPVAAMSASGAHLAAAEAAGVVAALAKPFDFDRVVSVIERY